MSAHNVLYEIRNAMKEQAPGEQLTAGVARTSNIGVSANFVLPAIVDPADPGTAATAAQTLRTDLITNALPQIRDGIQECFAQLEGMRLVMLKAGLAR